MINPENTSIMMGPNQPKPQLPIIPGPQVRGSPLWARGMRSPSRWEMILTMISLIDLLLDSTDQKMISTNPN
jgi:hypothetical protein